MKVVMTFLTPSKKEIAALAQTLRFCAEFLEKYPQFIGDTIELELKPSRVEIS